MRTLLADIRYAVRTLLGHPSFTLAAVLTLGLGIGITTSIFSVVNGVVLRPLPLRDAGRLVAMCEEYPGATPDWCSVSPPNVLDIAARSRSLEAIGMGRNWPATLATTDGAENINAGIASPGMFEALGFRAELGRLIEQDDMLGRPGEVAVITDAMWRTRFGAAPNVIGRRITLDGKPVTVVGVLEPTEDPPEITPQVLLWRPLHIDPRSEEHREWRGFVAYGKLKPGVTLGQFRGELAAITHDVGAEHFKNTRGWDVRARPLQDLVTGAVSTPLRLFLAAVFLVLLIACANVANLILARGSTRGREMAIRVAMGANRARMIGSLLTESVLLALAGAMLGLVIAIWATQAFKALAPASIPRLQEVGVDSTVLLFALGLALVSAIACGLAPALRASSVDLAQALREGGRAATARGRLGQLLVIGELAMSLPLVTGSALLARSFVKLTAWEPGFEREHLATFTLFLPATSYKKGTDIGAWWDQLEPQIASIPGVTSVATASGGPLFGGLETVELSVQGRPATDRISAHFADMSPGFFRTLGVPIVRGRDFGPLDTQGSESAALVNETLANRAWPHENPVGRRVEFSNGVDRISLRVIGVVRDIPPLKPSAPAEPDIYWSNRQFPRPFTYFLVRTSVPPATIAATIGTRLHDVNRELRAANFRTMSDIVASRLRAPRFNMLLMATFGIVALVLAAIGTYGLLAYVVAQRTRDIGIRVALGAQRRDVVGEVMRTGLVLAAMGVALGVVGSLSLARTLGSLVAGVSPRDPLTLVVSVAVVVAVAGAACLIPALRASRVDPVVALGAE